MNNDGARTIRPLRTLKGCFKELCINEESVWISGKGYRPGMAVIFFKDDPCNFYVCSHTESSYN